MSQQNIITELEAHFIQAKTDILSAFMREPVAKQDNQLMTLVYETLRQKMLLPKFKLEIKNKSLKIDNSELDLSGKEKLLSLFRVFLNSPNYYCSRDQLIEAVYNPERREVSERQIECYRQNLVKLVSRARRETNAILKTHLNLPLEWFAYHQPKASWRLVQIREY